jgi:hypothetical protein
MLLPERAVGIEGANRLGVVLLPPPFPDPGPPLRGRSCIHAPTVITGTDTLGEGSMGR